MSDQYHPKAAELAPLGSYETYGDFIRALATKCKAHWNQPYKSLSPKEVIAHSSFRSHGSWKIERDQWARIERILSGEDPDPWVQSN